MTDTSSLPSPRRLIDGEQINRASDLRGPSVRRYRGVYHEGRKGLFRARLYWRGTHTTIGRFVTAEAAARAHDIAAIYVFGRELAVTNFLTPASVCDAIPPTCFGESVRARLRTLRSAVRQEDRSAIVQVARDAQARRIAAATVALDWSNRRSISSAAAKRSFANKRLQALVLAALLAP